MNLARLRWRIARFVAPVPIVFTPEGQGPWLLLHPEPTDRSEVWLRLKTLKVEHTNSFIPKDMDLGDFGAYLDAERARTKGTIQATF